MSIRELQRRRFQGLENATPGLAGKVYAALERGVIPFIAMQMLAVLLMYWYPQIALWLPRAIGWKAQPRAYRWPRSSGIWR